MDISRAQISYRRLTNMTHYHGRSNTPRRGHELGIIRRRRRSSNGPRLFAFVVADSPTIAMSFPTPVSAALRYQRVRAVN
jgi:hypothetical protein